MREKFTFPKSTANAKNIAIAKVINFSRAPLSHNDSNVSTPTEAQPRKKTVVQMASTPLNFTNLINNESALSNLNEPHLTYDFPTSQYYSNGSTCAHSPYEDCTYEETPTNEVYTYEEMPRATSSKKAQRQANFTIEEDKLLVSASLNIGLDPVKGVDQKKKQLWKRITDFFEKHKKCSGEQSEKSLTNRWSTISSTMSKFCGHYSQIEHLRRSGYTEQDKIVEAKETFKKKEGHAFVLDHCWVILRFQQKWMDEHQNIERES
ncbi:hypothetical protein ABKV19_013708 [Rosa sericea]